MMRRIGTSRFGPRPAVPVARLAKPLPRSTASWPAVSIVILLCVQILFSPIFLTVLNSGLVLLAIALVLLTRVRVAYQLLGVLAAFAVITFLGLATGTGAKRYDYLKDGWYMLNPMLVLVTGYVLYMAKPDLASGLRAFVLGGSLVALFQLRGYIVDPSLVLKSIGTIRSTIGTGLYAPVLALVILLMYARQWREGLRLPNFVAVALLLLVLASVVGVFSRTGLLVVVIGVLAHLGCFAKREWFRLGVPLVLLLVFAFVLQLVVDVDSDRVMDTFIGKLARSFQEMFASDYNDLRSINLSYRGYETKRAFEKFAGGDLTQMLFGHGFGAEIDLGLSMPLSGENGAHPVRYITYLHNGYMFLLTKVGAVGMLLFIGALVYLYLIGRRAAGAISEGQQTRAAHLFQAAVVTLSATTYVIGGIFNKLDMFPFMLLTGYLLAYLCEDRVKLKITAMPSVHPRRPTLFNQI
jgi:O-Antigen ligase